MKYLELTHVRPTFGNTAVVVLNLSDIASFEKGGDPSGDTVVTLRDGRVFVVEESIRTITARIDYMNENPS